MTIIIVTLVILQLIGMLISLAYVFFTSVMGYPPLFIPKRVALGCMLGSLISALSKVLFAGLEYVSYLALILFFLGFFVGYLAFRAKKKS